MTNPVLAAALIFNSLMFLFSAASVFGLVFKMDWLENKRNIFNIYNIFKYSFLFRILESRT